MSFLPKEFSGSDEWCWILEFPSNNIGPLVKFQWEISVRLNPFSI